MSEIPAVEAGRAPALDLDGIASRWQLALDAAQCALSAARGLLPVAELGRRRRALALERQQTAELLTRVARVSGVRAVPWLSPVPMTPQMLGLPKTAKACLFDLDGVLTDSDVLHARAWGAVFDEFLLRLSDRTGWHFIPFDRGADYRAYIDGRPRLEGVHAFLNSRGIRVPEGNAGDPAEADTAWGLGKRKGEAVSRELRERRVTARAGARRYLEAAGRAGLKRGVISASASTMRMLEHAGLVTVVEDSIDADVISLERLVSPPAPDVPLAACRRLGVQPEETVLITHSVAGAVAGCAAGLAVVGIGEDAAGTLLGRAAERVAPSLRSLLDPRFVGSPANAAVDPAARR